MPQTTIPTMILQTWRNSSSNSRVLSSRALVLERRIPAFRIEWWISASNSSSANTSALSRNSLLQIQQQRRGLFQPSNSSRSFNNSCTLRFFASSSSSRRRNNNNSHANPFRNTYGTPFSVSPEQAIAQFQAWSKDQQGLPSWLVRNIAISAAYVPVWTLDVNVRYKKGGKLVRPSFFAPAYGSSNSTLHIPGLSAYAGYTYRRSLVDPVHSTTVLSLPSLQPFHADLLQDLRFAGQEQQQQTIPVFLDPWNAPRGRALDIVRAALLELGQLDATDDTTTSTTIQLSTQVLNTRRVYLPTYIVQYSILGMEYQAFVSGCNPTTPVSGISHALWESQQQQQQQQTSSDSHFHPRTVLQLWDRAVQTVGGRNVASILAVTLQWTASFVVRILTRIPWIAAVGGAYVGFRKIIRPWMDHRTATAEWERQREREAQRNTSSGATATEQHWEDFVDTGAAERYFSANRDRIVRHLTGQEQESESHNDRNSTTYAAWEQWARQQWEQSQQQQRQQQQTYQQQTNTGRSRQRNTGQRGAKQARKDYQWDFNPNDPYSVLGIQRGATAREVSNAFRQQMLRHHPDTKANASKAEQDRAIERSKLITNAYQTIKAEMKR